MVVSGGTCYIDVIDGAGQSRGEDVVVIGED